jgi:hypothetical protein
MNMKRISESVGAPGSGKGTNTPFILRERGITAPPIVMSELLTEHIERSKLGILSILLSFYPSPSLSHFQSHSIHYLNQQCLDVKLILRVCVCV